MSFMHRERLLDGNQPPEILTRPPGPRSRAWLERAIQTSAPMGPPRSAETGIVYEAALGNNVVDVDGNRYLDLAAGFGAMLLGHGHPRVCAALEEQARTLMQSLGDVYPSRIRLELEQLLLDCCGYGNGAVLFGQSGSDAVTAAVKTAMLATGKPSVIACAGAYHGLGHAPLALCGLRASYREPFAEQLNQHVTFLPYPADEGSAQRYLEQARQRLQHGDVGAVIIEPILGRGGCSVPPAWLLGELAAMTRRTGALLIADEIWTGLGRAGRWLVTGELADKPDLVCLGKGLGGGLPISACIGTREVMQAWRREPEVVHTATFSGAALAARAACVTLDILSEPGLMQRVDAAGTSWRHAIADACLGLSVVADVRGRGFMIGVDLGAHPGLAVVVMRRMLERGYVVSTGGGARDVVILTPSILIDEAHRARFVQSLAEVLAEFS